MADADREVDAWTGRVVSLPRVFTQQCSDCVGRPGNLMRLAPRRLRDLVESNLSTGTALMCHQTTHGQHPEIGETVCRWWWDSYGDRTNSIVVMGRMAAALGLGGDGFEHVAPPKPGPTHSRRVE